MLVIGAVDRSYGSELWIGAREIGIEMIGAREIGIEMIGAVDRGRVDSERERESFNRKNEKEKWFRERETERALSDK